MYSLLKPKPTGNIFIIGAKMYKRGIEITDEFFGESAILKGVLELEAELLDVNLTDLQSIKVIYQGCAEGKYCYPKRIKSL